MVDFTVAIRTYNGEERLPAVLEKLRSQVDVEALSWEIVIVDNNSNDGTAKLIGEYLMMITFPILIGLLKLINLVYPTLEQVLMVVRLLGNMKLNHQQIFARLLIY